MNGIDLRATNGYRLILSHDKLRGETLAKMVPRSRFHHVTSTEKAIHACRSLDTLIFLDLGIPNSMEIIQRLKNMDHTVDILIFDTDYDPDKCIQAKTHGAGLFFNYPPTDQSLQRLIDMTYNQLDTYYDFTELAYAHFLRHSSLDERLTLAKTYIRQCNETHTAIDPLALYAFFPLQQYRDQDTLTAIQTHLGQDIYTAFITTFPTILIVEDEASFRQWTHSFLKRFSPNCTAIGSYDEALVHIKSASTIDIALLDIELDHKTGIELQPDIIERFPACQMIMLTAYDAQDYVESSFNNRGFGYIVKTQCTPEILFEKITQALQKKAFYALSNTIGRALLIHELSLDQKYDVLADIARKRQHQSNNLQMKDVYVLFPELEASKIPYNRAISKHILQDGIGIFIDMVEHVIQTKGDWRELFDRWNDYVSE